MLLLRQLDHPCRYNNRLFDQAFRVQRLRAQRVAAGGEDHTLGFGPRHDDIQRIGQNPRQIAPDRGSVSQYFKLISLLVLVQSVEHVADVAQRHRPGLHRVDMINHFHTFAFLLCSIVSQPGKKSETMHSGRGIKPYSF